jgi:hypothetical protein
LPASTPVSVGSDFPCEAPLFFTVVCVTKLLRLTEPMREKSLKFPRNLAEPVARDAQL